MGMAMMIGASVKARRPIATVVVRPSAMMRGLW